MNTLVLGGSYEPPYGAPLRAALCMCIWCLRILEVCIELELNAGRSGVD